MSKLFAGLLLLGAVLGANEANFGFVHRFVLKKDQIAEVIVKKDYPKSFAQEGILRFRWTLYHNDRLILLADYEGFRYQYTLMQRYGRDSVKIYLTGDYKRIDYRPFVLLTFEKFDTNHKRAVILAQVSDPQKRLEIKITKPKR